MSQDRPVNFIACILIAILNGCDPKDLWDLVPSKLLESFKKYLRVATTLRFEQNPTVEQLIRVYVGLKIQSKYDPVSSIDEELLRRHFLSEDQKAKYAHTGLKYHEYFLNQLVQKTQIPASVFDDLQILKTFADGSVPSAPVKSAMTDATRGPIGNIGNVQNMMSQLPSACQQFLMPCLNVVFYLIQAVLARYTVNSFELACGLGAVATVFSGVMVYRHGNCLVRACLTSLAPVLIENLLEAYLGQHLPEPVNVGITFVVQCLVHFFADVSKRNLLRALALLGGLIGPITQASMVGVSYGTNPVNHTYKISLDPSKVRSTVVFSSGDTATYVPLVGEGCIMDVNTNQISIPDSEVFQQGPTWATCDYTKFRVYVETKSVDDKEVSRSGVFEEEMQVVSHEAIVKPFSEVASILESYGLGDVVMKIRDALPSFVRKSMGVGF